MEKLFNKQSYKKIRWAQNYLKCVHGNAKKNLYSRRVCVLLQTELVNVYNPKLYRSTDVKVLLKCIKARSKYKPYKPIS